jgi:hypothetical protein
MKHTKSDDWCGGVPMDTFSLVIIVVVAGSFLYAGYNIWRTKKNGIETDAFVTRIEERESHDSDGVTYYDDYYVRYQDQEGRTTEATISNPKRKGLAPGARIRIRYLPEKPNSVVYIGLKKDE